MAACAGLLMLTSVAQAQTKELTPQQKRMGDCAHASKGKKGDEYKQSMSECLKGKGTTPAPAAAPAKAAKAAPAAPVAAGASGAAPSQKDKMKTCNAQAKEKSLKGADRKTFMSSCLKA
jgi:hypothetical protein